MDSFLLKFNLLDKAGKQELLDFLDFLLARRKKKRSDLVDYKKKILSVSQWSESDINEIVNNQKGLY